MRFFSALWNGKNSTVSRRTNLFDPRWDKPFPLCAMLFFTMQELFLHYFVVFHHKKLCAPPPVYKLHEMVWRAGAESLIPRQERNLTRNKKSSTNTLASTTMHSVLRSFLISFQ